MAADIRVHLGQHERVAAAAEQLPRVSPNDRVEYLRAAQFLAKCVLLAGTDPVLKEMYGRRAVEMLRQAFARGFKEARELQAPAFDPLRHREDFKKLLERHGGKQTRMARRDPGRSILPPVGVFLRVASPRILVV